MHVVTFYSYKGGVGRTMALVNVAYELCRRGNRVLILDFDLEAPGISTYDVFSSASGHKGIVDYVVQFRESGEAPDISDYIVQCECGEQNELPIWVLPAGKRDATYTCNLHSINWQELYENHEGFLMFADLRQQLQISSDPKFDYVLIDSRTGYTDVGGICTRQLPNAVLMMFYPNEQNISGLANIVREVRDDRTRGKKRVELLFCPSNIPYLDDEEEILNRKLSDAKNQLGCAEFAGIIHHYQSLNLLDQPIFTRDRPKTRLSDEYRQLTEVIVQGNLEDRDGAISALEKIKDVLRAWKRKPKTREVAFADAVDKVDDIQMFHPNDGEIAWELAGIYSILGSMDNELAALTIAIDSNFNTLAARRVRAQNWLARNESDLAKDDLRFVLEAPSARPIDITAAATLLRKCDDKWLDAIIQSSAIPKLDLQSRVIIANTLTFDPRGANLVPDLIFDAPENSNDGLAGNVYILSLIASGRFKEAMDRSKRPRERYFESTYIVDVFNYAMAEWGHTGIPPGDLCHRVIELDNGSYFEKIGTKGANYIQCIALCHALLGNSDLALKLIHQARNEVGPGSIFSSWRYLSVDKPEMLNDLNLMEEAVLSGRIHPPFLDRARENMESPKS